MQSAEILSPSPQNANVNVNRRERWLSVVIGSAVAAYGLSRRSIAGVTLAGLGSALVWRGASGRCPVYGSLGITSVAETDHDTSNVSVPYGRGVRVEQTVTIGLPPEEIYAFFRNFENLPRFMSHLQSVTVLDDKRSHWVTKGPAGSDAEWDAEIINEIPGELLGWRTLDRSDVVSAGSVRFKRATGDRGTEVRVRLQYGPPAGKIGATVAWLLGHEPAQSIREDLRRFKQLMETGEVPTIAGQPRGQQSMFNYD